MRIIGYLCFYFTLGVIALIVFNNYLQKPIQLINIPYQLPNDVQVQTSKTYLLDIDKPLKFNLALAPDKVWLASSASITNKNQNILSNYQMSLEFFDAKDKLLFSHEHHTQTSIEQLQEVSGTRIPLRFFDDLDYSVGKSRSIYIRQDQYKNASYVVIHLLKKSKDIENIAVSFYQHTLTDNNLSPLMSWQRFSDSQKQEKAKAHALTADFLEPQEQFALAIKRWDPIAPEGIPNQDYSQRNLYRISPNGSYWSNAIDIKQFDHISDNYKAVTYAVHDKTSVTFRLQHGYTADKPYHVTMTWHPPHAGLPITKQYNFSQNSVEIKETFERGLVEFSSSIPVSITASQYDESKFPNEEHFISTYQVDDSNALTYELNNDDQAILPLRISMYQYQLLGQEKEQNPLVITYQWLDANKNEVKSGEFEINDLPNSYIQLHSPEPSDQLLYSKLSYFNIPKTVKSIVFNSSGRGLINVAMSPTNLDYTKQFPNHKRNWFDDETMRNRWHELRPDNWQLIAQSGSRHLLKTYHKPVTIAPEILAGDYNSQLLDTLPSGLFWRELLLPFSNINRVTQPNTQFVYSRIKSNENFKIDPTLEASPSLLFIKPNSDISKLNLHINGKKFAAQSLAGHWGKIKLNETKINNNIKYSNNDILWFINYQPVNGKDSYHARKAVAISQKQPVTFSVNKTSVKSNLLIRYYPSDKFETTLSINIDKPLQVGINTAFTRRSQRWQLAADNNLSGLVMQSNIKVGKEHRVPISLLDDLPQGNYQITISAESNSTGFIAVSQTTLGVENNQPIFSETGTNHD